MYWPLGAPRIYTANKRRRKAQNGADAEDTDGGNDAKDNAPIIGLRASRNGHLFTTITETALTVWQASVCIGQVVPANSD